MDIDTDKILARINSIETYYCPPTCLRLLHKYSQNTSGRGEIVEIGTFAGKSTISLALGQKFKKGKKIYTIDLYQHPQLQDNLKQFDVSDYVYYINNTSLNVGKLWTKPIELLWIDGGHSYACLIRDIQYWTKHVLPGGHAIFHDYPGILEKKYRNHWPDDVHRALHETLLKFPRHWKIIDDRMSDGHTIIFQKQSWSDRQYEEETIADHLRYTFHEKIFQVKNLICKHINFFKENSRSKD